MCLYYTTRCITTANNSLIVPNHDLIIGSHLDSHLHLDLDSRVGSSFFILYNSLHSNSLLVRRHQVYIDLIYVDL